MVFQDDALLPWRSATANVALALALALRGVRRREAATKAGELLAQVGLEGYEAHLPRQLSGGMRMRASLARTLVLDPAVVMFDEPFGATIGSVILADDGESHGTPVTTTPRMRGTIFVSVASGGASCIRGRYQRAFSVTNVFSSASQGLLVDKVARLLRLRTIG